MSETGEAREAPRCTVQEWVENAYEAFGIARHLAVGAVALAGWQAGDRTTRAEFRAAVERFLVHPVN